MIHAAIGSSDVDINIVGVFPWSFDTALADRFQVGRVLLAGDAAHRFPPTGGFGMNSGLQDAQNLAWKLAAVLRGDAGAELLETYATERRAAGQRNIRQMLENARATTDGWLLSEPGLLADIEKPEGAAIRQRVAESAIAQVPQYSHYGLQFGTVYYSSAAIPDGSELVASTTTEYYPTAYPGAHAPHVWLRSPSGERLSTVDLLHSRFVVLAAPAGIAWVDAARELSRELGIDIGAFTIGAGGDYVDDDNAWQRIYEVAPTGVVIVRPDGHVAFRAAELAEEQPGAVLKTAFQRLLHIGEPTVSAVN
jgi:tetracenomycin A2 monooxygenase-dioxygenase